MTFSVPSDAANGAALARAAAPAPPGGRWRQAIALFVPGFSGIVALGAVLAPQLRAEVEQIPGFPEVPTPVLAALAMLQPTLLLAGGVLAGVLLAPRLGVRSHLAAGVSNRGAIRAGWKQSSRIPATTDGIE